MQTVQRKICLLGSFSVGKTSLVRRYVEGRFDDKYLSTIGVKISRRALELAAAKVNLLIWDLAGGDDVLRSNKNYLRGSAGALIVCDLTRNETLDYANDYISQVRELNSQSAIVLLANKCDLVDQRQISVDVLGSFAKKMGNVVVLETSAKTGENVSEAFTRLAQQLV